MMLPWGHADRRRRWRKTRPVPNAGDEAGLKLEAAIHADVDGDNQSGGSRQSSSGNPDANQSSEDGFSAGIVSMLNKDVLDGNIEGLVVIAAPRALGEMRKHYHKTLSAKLLGEIALQEIGPRIVGKVGRRCCLQHRMYAG